MSNLISTGTDTIITLIRTLAATKSDALSLLSNIEGVSDSILINFIEQTSNDLEKAIDVITMLNTQNLDLKIEISHLKSNNEQYNLSDRLNYSSIKNNYNSEAFNQSRDYTTQAMDNLKLNFDYSKMNVFDNNLSEKPINEYPNKDYHAKAYENNQENQTKLRMDTYQASNINENTNQMRTIPEEVNEEYNKYQASNYINKNKEEDNYIKPNKTSLRLLIKNSSNKKTNEKDNNSLNQLRLTNEILKNLEIIRNESFYFANRYTNGDFKLFLDNLINYQFNMEILNSINLDIIEIHKKDLINSNKNLFSEGSFRNYVLKSDADNTKSNNLPKKQKNKNSKTENTISNYETATEETVQFDKILRKYENNPRTNSKRPFNRFNKTNGTYFDPKLRSRSTSKSRPA